MRTHTHRLIAGMGHRTHVPFCTTVRNASFCSVRSCCTSFCHHGTSPRYDNCVRKCACVSPCVSTSRLQNTAHYSHLCLTIFFPLLVSEMGKGGKGRGAQVAVQKAAKSESVIPEVPVWNHWITSGQNMYLKKNETWTKDNREQFEYAETKGLWDYESADSRRRPKVAISHRSSNITPRFRVFSNAS